MAVEHASEHLHGFGSGSGVGSGSGSGFGARRRVVNSKRTFGEVQDVAGEGASATTPIPQVSAAFERIPHELALEDNRYACVTILFERVQPKQAQPEGARAHAAVLPAALLIA